VLKFALLVGVCVAGDISTLPSGSTLPTDPMISITSMIFSPDGTRLFVGSSGKVDVFAYDKDTKDISKLTSGSTLPTNPNSYARSMIFSQDRTRLFVVYNPTNNGITAPSILSPAPDSSVTSMIFSKDGTRLFVGSNGRVDVFAYSTGINYKYVYFFYIK